MLQVKLNEGKDLLDFNPTLVDLKLLPAALEGFTPCVDEVEQTQVTPCCTMPGAACTHSASWWLASTATGPVPYALLCIRPCKDAEPSLAACRSEKRELASWQQWHPSRRPQRTQRQQGRPQGRRQRPQRCT